jgi:hypothetical protein
MKRPIGSTVLLMGSYVALMAGAILTGLQAMSTKDSRRTAEQATEDCLQLADQIRAARRDTQLVVDRPVQDDRIFAHLIAAIQDAGLPSPTLASANPIQVENDVNRKLLKMGLKVHLLAITQSQLLAFLNSVHRQDLPLIASAMDITASQPGTESDENELWDAKVLLTYSVRSTKSPQ